VNIELKKKREARNTVIRWVFYFVIMAFSYVFISTVQTGYSIPLLLIPAAVCAALREQPFGSAVYACVCGLLLDSAQGTLPGFNALLLMWMCVMVSLLLGYLMRRNILSFLILDLAATAIQSLLHYLFFYAIWGYDEGHGIFTGIFIPEFIFTNIAGVLMYLITTVISKTFGTVTEHYIEEKSDDIVRE